MTLAHFLGHLLSPLRLFVVLTQDERSLLRFIFRIKDVYALLLTFRKNTKQEFIIMARQLSLVTLLFAILLSFCVTQTQAFSFDDLTGGAGSADADDDKKKKKKKICKIPGLEFLCKEDEEPPNSADSADPGSPDGGRRSLRA